MVSVILTTYNRAHLVAESIYSVLHQTYSDLELLIVDDGSTDETQQLVEEIYDARIRYFKMPHTGRTAILKNYALQQAKGQYLAFIDSDDWWHERKLEKQLQLLIQQPGIGFSITDAITIKDGAVLSPRTYPRNQGVEYASIFDRLKENRFVVYNPTLLMRRHCIDKTGGFDETMPFGSDYHFNMRLAWHYQAGILYESLLWRRLHEGNESSQLPVENYEGFVQTFEYLYQQRMVSKKYLHRAKGHAFYSIGNIYRQRQDLPKARKHYRQSLVYNPIQLRSYWKLLVS